MSDPIPAPNYDLLDFEGQLEPAIAAAIMARITNNAPMQQGKDALKVPRVEVKLVVHNCEEHFQIVPGSNPIITYPDIWSATATLKIVTNRASEKGQRTHAQIRAACRWMMVNHKYYITPALTHHTITYALESGTQLEIGDEREDISEVSFRIIFNIKPGSFPTS